MPSTEDSLIPMLETRLDDSMRVAVLNRLFKLNLNNNPHKAENWELEALRVANHSGQPGLIGMINNNLGVLYSRRGNYESALAYYEKAKEFYNKAGGDWVKDSYNSINNIGTTYYKMGRYDDALKMFYEYLGKQIDKKDTVGISKALNNIGSALKEKGNFSEAVENYMKSLSLMEALNDSVEIARVHINLSNIYKDQGLLEETYLNIRKALDLMELANNKYELCGALSVMGDYYIEVDSLALAEKFHQRCLSTAEQVGDQFHISSSKVGLGEIAQKSGKLKEAEFNYTEALKGYREIGRVQSIAYALNHLGKLHLETRKYSAAIPEFEEALALASEIRSPDEVNKALKGLAEAWHGAGNDVKAFDFLRRHLEVNDSLFTVEKHRQIAGMQSRHQAAENQKKIDLLTLENVQSELENTQNRNTITILVAGIVLVIFLAGGFFVVLRQRIRYSHEIEKRNEEIRLANEMLEERVRERTLSLSELNKELDTFLYEAAHAMRRPIQRVRGLDSLIEKENDAGKRQELLGMVDLTLDGIDKMLRHFIELNEITSRKPLKERVHLGELANEIFAALPSSPVKLFVENESLLVWEGDPFLLRVMLTHVIENSIDFRNRNLANPEIRISAERVSGNLRLKVRDNGMGIAEEAKDKIFEMFFRGTVHSQGQGLGLYVARKAVEKSGGKIEMRSSEGAFTEITITL